MGFKSPGIIEDIEKTVEAFDKTPAWMKSDGNI